MGLGGAASPAFSEPKSIPRVGVNEAKPIMLVFLVGGLSFLEIAAFRYLSRDPSFPYTIVMATTKLTNGSRLLQSLMHDFKAN